MAIKKFKSGTGGNSFLIFLIVLVAVIVFVTFAKVTQSTFRTETYYVLAGEKDTKVLSTNDVITPEMLVPVTTSEAPENALDVSEFQDGKRRARYDLNGGDILTESNTADEDTDILDQRPDNMVLTNFSVPADDAVGGSIEAGQYFDIMIATPEGSFYPFVNVLTIYTTVDLNEATSPDAINTEESQSGMRTQYYVAMTPENAAKLHSIIKTYPENIKLVRSPKANLYQPPQLSDYEGMFQYNAGAESPIAIGPEADYTEETQENQSAPEQTETPENNENMNLEPETTENNENMDLEPETTENLVDLAKEIAQDVE